MPRRDDTAALYDRCIPMKCAACESCCAHPYSPSSCVFGGPFEGYETQPQETKDAKVQN